MEAHESRRPKLQPIALCLSPINSPNKINQVTISLDRPLLSGEQRALLNPMVVTLQQTYNLPKTPVAYEKLDDLCHSTTAVFTPIDLNVPKVRG